MNKPKQEAISVMNRDLSKAATTLAFSLAVFIAPIHRNPSRLLTILSPRFRGC